MIKRISYLVILAALLLSACAAATPAPGADQAESRGGASTGFAPPAATAAPELGARAGDAVATERLVIKNATLTLVVKDPAASVDSISTLADGQGGFVVSSNVYQA